MSAETVQEIIVDVPLVPRQVRVEMPIVTQVTP